MRTTALGLAFAAFSAFMPAALSAQPPAVPNTATASTTQAGMLMGQVVAASTTPTFPAAADVPQPAVRTHADREPVRVSIPAIKLNDPVENMGILQNGELAVPSGSTDYVGWWSGGTEPGQVGSAVLDAHVFAAFKNLNGVKPGDSIYITDADGTTLHFVVQTTEVFKLADLSASYLFDRADAKRLTLITCAGQLTPDHSTYTERLVVSAVLAS